MSRQIKFAFIPELDDSIDLEALNYTDLKLLVDPDNPWIVTGTFTYQELKDRISLIVETTAQKLANAREPGIIKELKYLGEAMNAYMLLHGPIHDIYIRNRDDLIVIV